MKVFLKYIGKSVLEKKGRLLLLIGSIAISISFLIGTLSASDTLSSMLNDQMKGVYGNYNVQINTSSESEKFLFSDDCLDNETIKSIFKSVAISCKYKDDDVNFVGTTLKDFEQLDKIRVIEKDALDLMEKNGVIISQKTSKNLALKLKDKFELNILNEKKEFKVVGIATDTGFFGYDTDESFTVFGSEETLRDILGVTDELYSNIYIEKESDDINAWIKEFNDSNKSDDIVASLTIDENSINGQLNWLKLTLYFMLAIILIMTIFIISSTFKLIITERLPIIGTFMSQGATFKKIISLLLIESCCYGILGGIIGCVGGIITTRIITDFANPLSEYGIEAERTVNIKYFVISFVFAIVMSLISAYLSVGGIKKLQVKEVILNMVADKEEKGRKRVIFGVICFLITLIIYIIDSKINYSGAILSLFLFIVGIILLIPFFVEKILGLIEKINNRSSVLAMLAFNNVKSSSLLKSTITLLSVCIIAIIMMLSLSKSILTTINTAYSKMYYDINIQMKSKNYQEVEDVIDKLKDDGDISSIIGISSIHATLNDKATNIVDIYCVDPEKYLDFEDYMRYYDKKKQFDELKEEPNGIIVSKLVSKNYSIKEGDEILLKVENKEVKMKVMSIIDARMFANGNYNIITKEAAKELFGIKYSTEYYLRQADINSKLIDKLKDELDSLGCSVMTKTELIKRQEDEISKLVDILNFITLLTILIGSISCMGNISINFMKRRKELAVMNSVGLTNGRCTIMLLIECISQAILACSIAFVASLIIDELFVGVYKFLDMDLVFEFPVKISFIILVATLALVILLSLTTIFKSRKIRIIEEIKYE